MKLKVLITGRNKKVGNDVAKHLENDRGYITVKCDPSKTALFDVTLAELPKVVIVCLGDETKDTIRALDVLKNASIQGTCKIIVITNDDDEKLFVKYSGLYKVLFLARPVSLFALYEKLEEIEEEFEKNKEKNLSAFREYVNEDAKKGPRRKHIVVVDDDTEQLVNIREQLEEFYDITLLKSGDALFKYLLKEIPDLILLDYLMPEVDGPDVLRKMRTVEQYAQIPVIFLTGVSEKKAVIATLTELLPQGYIIKPAKKSKIVSKIIDVLG